jgi:hypothetical protein
MGRPAIGTIERMFNEYFANWDIRLPKEALANRRRGKLQQRGWMIWYLFDEDEQGEYLDFYAAHRMTNDLHERIYEDGSQKLLPALPEWRRCSDDPDEDAQLEADHHAFSDQVADILKAKGFLD